MTTVIPVHAQLILVLGQAKFKEDSVPRPQHLTIPQNKLERENDQTKNDSTMQSTQPVPLTHEGENNKDEGAEHVGLTRLLSLSLAWSSCGHESAAFILAL